MASVSEIQLSQSRDRQIQLWVQLSRDWDKLSQRWEQLSRDCISCITIPYPDFEDISKKT